MASSLCGQWSSTVIKALENLLIHLANLQVRTAVLSILQRLPIDLNQEGRKTQLKKSQLGRYVAFYSKLQDETLANRKLARGLVETWSRAIYEQYKEGGEEEAKQASCFLSNVKITWQEAIRIHTFLPQTFKVPFGNRGSVTCSSEHQKFCSSHCFCGHVSGTQLPGKLVC